MLWNRPGVPARNVSPHSKLSVSCAFMGFWGDRSETEDDFQGYFLFLRLILTIWEQYGMLGYYVFKIICMSLEQDTCNFHICHGSAHLVLFHQFVKQSRKKQILLLQRDSDTYSWVQEALASLPSPHHAWCVSRCCGTEQSLSELCFWLMGWSFSSPRGRVTGDLGGTRTEQGEKSGESLLSQGEQFHWGRKNTAPSAWVLPMPVRLHWPQSDTDVTLSLLLPLYPRAVHAHAASCC